MRFGSCASLLLPVISVAALIAAACTSSATPSVAPASSGAIVRTELGTTLPSNAPGQRLGLWHYTIPAGQALVPHRHPGWQIARITSGTLTYTILTGTVTVVRGGGAQETHGAGETIKLNAGDTVIESPVDGFIGKRYLDPGATVSPNAPVASVVDIHIVRMVANVVEKDVKRLHVGMPALVEVDAFPGEKFTGKVSRIAPIFDPQTRTAPIEPGMP